MNLGGKFSQEYPVNTVVPQGSILGPRLFPLCINDVHDDVICDIGNYSDDTTLYSKCDQASNLWQQLELASELESDLWDTVDWVKKWLVDFKAEKTQLDLSDQPVDSGSIDVKMDGWPSGVFWEFWCWTSLLNWIGALTLSLLLKLPSRKLKL